MATSLKILEKKIGLIICNSIPTILCKDCENRSSGFWITLAPSEHVRYDTKLVSMARSLEILKKNFRSIIYIQNAFIWYTTCKNCTWFVFCLPHKIGCHGNVPWWIGKTGTDQENSRKYLPLGNKDRENRSSRYWDSFAHSKKIKKKNKKLEMRGKA